MMLSNAYLLYFYLGPYIVYRLLDSEIVEDCVFLRKVCAVLDSQDFQNT